ncbi:hypothetical protein SpCBS45565_g07897 [Spizellomyces sp. 'palustris']|nr:hypothetical protein SpCBS45565_g07897 [Spizellomyces sp. 'palustris']
MLSNEKPSAIFKLGGSKSVASTAFSGSDVMMDDTLVTPGVAATIPAQLGISVEPIDVVMAQVSRLQPSSSGPATSGALLKSVDPAQLVTKILENFYNHCSGFAGNLPLGGNALFGMDWNTTFIPLKAVQDWYNSMQRKLKLDPSGNSLFKS